MPDSMKSQDIFNLLLLIRGESSSIRKVDLLKELLDDDDFRRVVVLAYDPNIRFYIVDLPPIETGLGDFTAWTWKIFELLSSRMLSGDKARITILTEFTKLNFESQQLFRNILKKDLKAGINNTLINKAYGNLIQTFAYMRASLPKDINFRTFDWKKGVYAQEKADGQFVNITLKEDSIALNTRLGKPFDNALLSPLIAEINFYLDTGFQYHGEILALDKRGKTLPRKISNGLINRILNGNQVDNKIIVKLWDWVPVRYAKKGGKFVRAYFERFEYLRAKVAGSSLISAIDYKIVNSFQEAEAYFDEMRKLGKEGVILKDRYMIWKDGTSRGMVKLKAEKSIDLLVTGYIPGTGKNENTFGSLVCKSGCGRIIVNVSGFTDEERLNTDWIGKIIEVKYNELIQNKENPEKYSLYLPRYEDVRLDKDIPDDLETAL